MERARDVLCGCGAALQRFLQASESSTSFVTEVVLRVVCSEASEPPQAVAQHVPLGGTALELAVDEAIACGDLLAAMTLVEDISKLEPSRQMLITTKLQLRFPEFPVLEFKRELRRLSKQYSIEKTSPSCPATADFLVTLVTRPKQVDSQADHDSLKEFLKECCEVGPGFWSICNELAAGYEWWSKRKPKPGSRSVFYNLLANKGFVYNRSRRLRGKQARTVEGVALRADVRERVFDQARVSAGIEAPRNDVRSTV